MATPRDIHPNEWVQVRPVHPDEGEPVLGYELVRDVRTSGTQEVRLVDECFGLPGAGNALGLISAVAGAGALSNVSTLVTTTEGAQGVLAMAAGTAAGNFSAAYQVSAMRPGTARLRLTWRVAVEALSTAAQEYQLAFGLGDQWSGGTIAPTTSGLTFRYDRATDGDFWSTVVTVGGVATKVVSSVAPAATFSVFELDVGEAGQWAKFYINNVLIRATYQDVTGFLLGAGLVMRKTVGATQRSAYVDFVQLLLTDGAER